MHRTGGRALIRGLAAAWLMTLLIGMVVLPLVGAGSATETVFIRRVMVVGASPVEQDVIARFLFSLTDEQIAAIRAIHIADAQGYLAALGVFMPTDDEWGGAWAHPYQPGSIVLRHGFMDDELWCGWEACEAKSTCRAREW